MPAQASAPARPRRGSLEPALGPVRARLLILVLALFLPAAAIAAYLVGTSYNDGRRAVERQLLETARALSLVVDRQIGQSRILLQALSAVLPADDAGLEAFDTTVRRAIAGTDAWVVLSEEDGRLLVNTQHAWRTSPPNAPPSALQPIVWTPIEGSDVSISTLFRGVSRPEPLIALRRPVPGPAAERYLAVVMPAQSLEQVLADQALPQNWTGTILDRQGNFVARNLHAASAVGSRIGGRMLQMMQEESSGVLTTVSLENIEAVAAFSRSPVSGWSFIVAVPETELTQALTRSLGLGIGAFIAVLVFGASLAVWIGRGIVRPIEQLAGGAQALASGDQVEIPPGGLLEADIAARALNSAAGELRRRETALRQSQERLELAVRSHSIGIFDWDLRTDQVVWTEQEERLFGLPPGTFKGDLRYWVGAVLPEDRAMLAGRLADARARGESLVDFDFRIRRPDGELRWLEGSGRYLYGPDGTALRMVGLNFDVTERRRAEEARMLLAREVDHRAKNALAVVQSLVRLTPVDTPERFAAAIEGRIGALARAHALLAAQRWTGARLRAVLLQELEPFLDSRQPRATLGGPDILLAADAVQPVSLILHEMVTNAAKHGALSQPAGRVRVLWSEEAGGLRLSWQEEGAAAAPAPERNGRGFGATLIEASARQLGGSIAADWHSAGLSWRLDIPAAQYSVGGAAPAGGDAAVEAGGGEALVGLAVLAVEDNAITAMAMAADLRALGCEVTVSGSLEEADSQARSRRFDAAILDVDLGGLPVYPVADRLVADGVPILFATGFNQVAPGEDRWNQVPVLEKPYTRADLARMLGRVMRQAGSPA